MPPRSIKAPYSVIFLTTPSTTWPSAREASVFSLARSRSSSSNTRRDRTIFPRRLFSLMIRIGNRWPISRSRLRTGRRSIWEPGKNALSPTSTISPPLIRATTIPSTISLLSYFLLISSQILILLAFSLEKDHALLDLLSLRGRHRLLVRLGDPCRSPEIPLSGNDPFRFVANVHQDRVPLDLHDPTLVISSFLDVIEAYGKFFHVHLFIVVWPAGADICLKRSPPTPPLARSRRQTRRLRPGKMCLVGFSVHPSYKQHPPRCHRIKSIGGISFHRRGSTAEGDAEKFYLIYHKLKDLVNG